MKKLVFVIVLIFAGAVSYAQPNSNNYLWPIEGAEAGTNIICAPQGYIGEEFNFDDLFIGAEEGTTVLAPADGVITSLRVGYQQSLNQTISYKSDKANFDEKIKEVKLNIDKSLDPQYLNGKMVINVGNGIIIYIYGLKGDVTLKEGQRVKKGAPIGKVAYSYYKIKRPSICIGIGHNGKSSDPMTPFGLKSSYIPPKTTPPVTEVTNKQAKEDFLLHIGVLKELFPGLYNVITPEELDRYVNATVARIDAHPGKWPIGEFRDLMRETVAKIHDSHIYMFPPTEISAQTGPPFLPEVRLGWIGDTLICTNATARYERLIGKPVESVNGIPADSMKAAASARIGGYDMQAAEYKNFILATEADRMLFEKPVGNGTFDMDVSFSDGETVEIKGYDTRNGTPAYVYSDRFLDINTHPNTYSLRNLNDSTAYIGFTNLSQGASQQEEIAAFIRSIAGKPNLIIDVRNNDGGLGDVTEKIYSFITNKPVVVSEYEKVKKTKGMKTLQFSTNYAGMTELFSDFEPIEGKEGYYNRSAEGRLIVPDSVTNYKGKVYVLVNERSASAATSFPALAMKEGRGVIIGRETRTGYHHMTAEKFAETLLPHSRIKIKTPLIELGFDTAVTERTPYGRGVIPDHIVPLTLEELQYKNGDAILNYTLDLIGGDTGKPAGKPEDPGMPSWVWFVIIGGTLIAARFLYFVNGNWPVFNKLRKKKYRRPLRRETGTGRLL